MDEGLEGNIIDFAEAKKRFSLPEKYPLGIPAFEELSGEATKRLEEYALKADTKGKRKALKFLLESITRCINNGHPDTLDLEVFDPGKGINVLPPMDVQMEFKALAFRHMADKDPSKADFARSQARDLMDKAEILRMLEAENPSI